MKILNQKTARPLYFASLLFASLTIFSIGSCKEEEEAPPPVTTYGSALINGSLTTFTRYTFKKFVLPGNLVRNEIALSRSDNSQILISFMGSEPGDFILPNADSLNYCAYIDPGDRKFISDSGNFKIDTYKIDDGVISASGFFAFRGRFTTQSSGLSNTVEVGSGTFIELTAE
jgi:hypothetical protein